MCLQLTDNVTLSTAGAVQRFLDACEAAILQANNRTVEEALATYMSNTTNATDVYSIANEAGSRTKNKITKTCPTCLNNTYASYRECCGNGQCEDGVCKCREGWFHTEPTGIHHHHVSSFYLEGRRVMALHASRPSAFLLTSL